MKKSIGPQAIVQPNPVFLVGSYTKEEKPNIAAVAWGGICCSNPPCVAVSLREATLTYHNLKHHKAFTVNIPSENYVKEADFAGIYSGRDIDKFKVLKLTPIKSKLVNAPIVEEFPLTLECKVIKITELGLHTQFIGEILDVKVENTFLTEDGKGPDIEKVKPIIFASLNNRSYYSVGSKIANAFNIGKKK